MHPVSPSHPSAPSHPDGPQKGPDSFVLFGATGDLAWRMLFPSLFFLESEGLLPPGLTIVGAARSDMTDEAFVAKVAECVRGRAGAYFSETAWDRFKARLRYAVVDAQDPASFKTLKGVLGGAGEIVFYLSTSPSLFGPICEALKAAKLISGKSRVVVEKPIGHDLASCRAINDTLAASFSEDRIFRVDHYLGKEAVQNLLSLRFANALFEPLWNKANIEYIQITVAETVGVEGRWDYYNNYGALRDMVQNHLLQLLCIMAMEPPASSDPDAVRDEKLFIYATGLGVTQGAAVNTGVAVPASPAAVTGTVSVYFGNPLLRQSQMIVNSSILMPGFVGVDQIQITVPGFHTKGSNLQVTLKIGGVSSSVTGPDVPLVTVN